MTGTDTLLLLVALAVVGITIALLLRKRGERQAAERVRQRVQRAAHERKMTAPPPSRVIREQDKYPAQKPSGARRLSDEDIATHPVIYGGSLYAAPESRYDSPLPNESRVDSSPAADTSSDSGSSDGGSSSGGDS